MVNKTYYIVLTLVLLLGLTSAMKIYDEEAKTYETYDWFFFNKYDIKLNTVSDSIVNAYADGELRMYKDAKVFKKIYYKNIFGQSKEFKQDDKEYYKIYINNSYMTYKDISEPVCTDTELFDEYNQTYYTVTECVDSPSVWVEDRIVDDWVLIDQNQQIPEGYYKWKIEAKKPFNQRVDFIIQTDDEGDLTEWAWWDSDWEFKRELTVTANNGNLTFFTLDWVTNMQTDFGDIRFVDSTETTELNYTIQSYVDSTNVTVRVQTNGESTFYLYYGNDAVNTTGNFSQTHLIPNVYYALDELSGTTVVDSMQVINGSNTNVLVNQDGTIYKAYYFDGADSDVLTVAENSALEPTALTVNVWFNLGLALGSQPNTYTYLIDKRSYTLSEGYEIYLLKGSTQLLMSLYGAGGNNGATRYQAIANVGNLNASQWYMATLTYDGTTLRSYLDGISVANTTNSTGIDYAGSVPLYIGRDDEQTSTSNINGTLDEIGIWNRALSYTEIQYLKTYTEPTITVGDEQSNKIEPNVTLTIDKTSPQTYLTTINISCTTDSNSTLAMYIDDVDYTSLLDQDIVLGAGTMEIKCNVSENDYYQGKENATNFTIDKATPSGVIVGTTPKAQGVPVDIQGTESNTGDDDVNYTLYRDGVLVDNPDLNDSLAIGNYSYIFNSTEGANYSAEASLDTFDLEVVVAPGISVVLDSPANNTYSPTNYIELTANTTAVGGAGLDNSTVYVWNSTTGTVIYTNTQTQTGLTEMLSWNVTLLSDGVHHWNVYTCSNDTNLSCVWATTNRTFTIDTIIPVVTILYPVASTIYDSVTQINYTAVDTNGVSCVYSKNGGANSTAVSFGTNFTNVTVQDLANTWTVYCNDSAGNIGLDDVTFTVNKIAITLNSPADASTIYTNLVTFNITATINDALTNLTNVSIYDNSSGSWASRNSTTMTGITDTDVLTLNYSAGTSILWNAYACDTDGFCQFSNSNRTYTIDNIAPTLRLNYPVLLNYQKVGDTIQLNYTANDTNLDYCWYNYNWTDSTKEACTSGTNNLKNITLTSQKNVTIYANDTAQNLNTTLFTWDYKMFNAGETYEASVFETQNTDFSVDLDYDSSLYSVKAILNYDDDNYTATETSGTFSVNFDVPLVASGVENKTFFWYLEYLSLLNSSDTGTELTAELNQTVNPINVSDCSSGNVTLNFTTYDEETYNSRLQPYSFYGTFEYWLGDGDVKKTLSVNNVDVNETLICLDVNETKYYTDAIIQYEKTGYVKRDYYFNNASLSTTTTNVKLILLNSSLSTSFVVPVKDSSQRPLTDAYVYIQKYYPGDNVFEVVEIIKTDDSGNALANLEVETEDYKFIVVKDGETLYTSEPQKVYCSSAPCTLPIQIVSTGIVQWETLGNLTSLSYTGPDYDSETNTISYTYVDSSGTTSYGRLYVYKQSALGKTTICDTNSTSSAATLQCNVTGYEGAIIAEAYISRSPEVFVWSEAFSISTIKSLISFEGLFWALLIIAALAIAGVSLGGIPGGVIGSIVGMFVVSIFGIATFGVIFFWGIIILGVFIIWVLRN